MWFLEGIGASRAFSSTLVAVAAALLAALLESAAKRVLSEAQPAADPIPSVNPPTTILTAMLFGNNIRMPPTLQT